MFTIYIDVHAPDSRGRIAPPSEVSLFLVSSRKVFKVFIESFQVKQWVRAAV